MSVRFPPRIFRRVPFEAELRLRFEGGEEVTARSANISLGGMFVVAAEPRPVGSTFELSFKLPEQKAPVRGRGRVAWVRQEGEGPGLPAGMGVRFLELTPGSRELIFEVVERRVRDGGSPYDDGEDTGTIADRRGGGGAVAAAGAAAAAAPFGAAIPPDLPSAEPLPWLPAAPSPVRPSARPPAGGDLDASGSRRATSAPPAPAAERPRETSFAEPAAAPAPAPAAVAPWDLGPAAPFEDEPEPPAPPERPVLPPVEMPDPPRARWDDAGRGGHPGAAGGYARARRRRGLGWWLAAGAAIALMAGGAWWLLRGEEEVAIAAADRPPATTGPTADEPAGDVEPGGAGGLEDASADPAAAVADTAEAAGASDGAVPPGSARGAAGPGGSAAAPRPAAGAAATAPSAAGAPAPPAAAPPVVTPAPASAGPVRRITHITWRQEDGATELVIWGDGRFDPGAVRLSTIGGERPRALVRLIGIGAPFDGGSVEVGTAEVQRVRSGLHLETEPDELHLVVDLASERVTASQVQEDGERLRLRLEGP